MTVKVLRVELPRSIYDQITATAGGASIGSTVSAALRTSLPALKLMNESPFAKGSQSQIAIDTELRTGLSALRRQAELTPPPVRFTQTVQLAIPTELWSEVERERVRLGLSIDDVVRWAWRHR